MDNFSKKTVTVIGVSDELQLRKCYGPEMARTIRDALQTRLVMRTADAQSAKSYAEAFGKGSGSGKDDAGPQDEAHNGRVEK